MARISIKPALMQGLIDSEVKKDITTLQVLFIVFVAALIRSAFGFGEALIAVPLLAFCIPLKVAAPLAVLVSITIARIDAAGTFCFRGTLQI